MKMAVKNIVNLVEIFFIVFYILITNSYTIADELPDPENEIFAKEQKLLGSSKTIKDEALTCGQLIVSRGFNYEQHFVTTQDGYILQLYRIVNPYAKQSNVTLKTVLLVHGILLSCSGWMLNDPNGNAEPWIDGNPPENVTSNSLAFVLASLEYDVWLGNNRGTSYSRNHTSLDPDSCLDNSFWDFSFNEMGLYDIPAMVDYVLEVTEREKLIYIGYSQGTVQMFIQLAQNPEFNNKLDLNINLAPAIDFVNLKGLLGFIPPDNLYKIVTDYSIISLEHGLAEFDSLLVEICSSEPLKMICIGIYGSIFGNDEALLDKSRFSVLLSLIDSISRKDILHFIQSFKKDRLHKYDYGLLENLIKYNSTEPPTYAFENIPSCNLVLFSGLSDPLASPESVQNLRDTIKGKPLFDYIIPYTGWVHTDFIFGTGSYEYSHRVLVEVIRHYSSQLTPQNDTKCV